MIYSGSAPFSASKESSQETGGQNRRWTFSVGCKSLQVSIYCLLLPCLLLGSPFSAETLRGADDRWFLTDRCALNTKKMEVLVLRRMVNQTQTLREVSPLIAFATGKISSANTTPALAILDDPWHAPSMPLQWPSSDSATSPAGETRDHQAWIPYQMCIRDQPASNGKEYKCLAAMGKDRLDAPVYAKDKTIRWVLKPHCRDGYEAGWKNETHFREGDTRQPYIRMNQTETAPLARRNSQSDTLKVGATTYQIPGPPVDNATSGIKCRTAKT